MDIIFSRKLATALLNHARQSPEGSVYGVITTQRGQPYACHPIDDKYSDTSINNVPLTEGEEIFAVYQSYPDLPALPVAGDMQILPNLIHCYISLNTKGVLEMRAFQYIDNAEIEVDIAVG